MRKVRYIAVIAVALLGYGRTYGQDRVHTLDSVDALAYWYKPSFVLTHDMAVRNRVWIPEEVKNRSSVLGIAQERGKGSFQPAQGADGLSQFKIYTEGKTIWQKTHFWGRFSYNRSSEDSTALRHQTRRNLDAPFYFGSLRKNKYNRETYQLDAGIQRSFFNDRLPVSLGVDYRLGSHYSNNDPRGDIRDMNLQFEWSVGHSMPKIAYHVSGIWGYGSERVSVGYKNDKYTSNTSDPLYVNWMMNGFGNATERLKEINYSDIIGRKGAGVHVLLKPNSRNKVYLNGRHIVESQSFRRNDNSAQTYSSINDYDRKTSTVDLLWSRQLAGEKLFRLALVGQMLDGKDYNYSYLANSYTYRRHELLLKSQYGFKQYVIEGNIGSFRTEKKDGVTSNQMEFDQLMAGFGLNRTFVVNATSELSGTIGYAKRWSPQHHLYVSELNTANFAKQVLYQDYLYDAAASDSWSMSWIWGMRRNKNNWSIQAHLDYQRRGAMVSVSDASTYTVGRDWFSGKLGVAYIF